LWAWLVPLILPLALAQDAMWSRQVLFLALEPRWLQVQIAIALAISLLLLAGGVAIGLHETSRFLRRHSGGIPNLIGVVRRTPVVLDVRDGRARVSFAIETEDGRRVTVVSDPRAHYPRASLVGGWLSQRVIGSASPGSEWRGLGAGDEVSILGAAADPEAPDTVMLAFGSGLLLRGGLATAYTSATVVIAIVVGMILFGNPLASGLAKLLTRG
jgi:hypothetical protein